MYTPNKYLKVLNINSQGSIWIFVLNELIKNPTNEITKALLYSKLDDRNLVDENRFWADKNSFRFRFMQFFIALLKN